MMETALNLNNEGLYRRSQLQMRVQKFMQFRNFFVIVPEMSFLLLLKNCSFCKKSNVQNILKIHDFLYTTIFVQGDRNQDRAYRDIVEIQNYLHSQPYGDNLVIHFPYTYIIYNFCYYPQDNHIQKFYQTCKLS